MAIKLSRHDWIRTIVYSSLAFTGGVGYLSSKLLEVVRVDVPIKGLSKRLDGLKIGVMSDFHAGAFTTRGEIVRAVKVLEREKPDFIALLGDYVDGAYSHSSKNVEKGMSKFDIAYRDVIKKSTLALVAMLLVVFSASDGYCNAGIPVYMRR